MLHRILVLAVFFFVSSTALPAAEWGWKSTFTEASSEELRSLHTAIHSPNTLSGVQGVKVRDVVWSAPTFDFKIEEGVVYLEPEIDGSQVGAFFVGKATVSFEPASKKAQGDVDYYFGGPAIEGMEATSAYFFTLGQPSLLEQLGVDASGDVPFDAAETMTLHKRALRQQGTWLTHRFLNRDGYAKGARFVSFAAPAIRTGNSDEALLLYSFDPCSRNDISLEAFGHDEIVSNVDYRYYFWGLTSERSGTRQFKPEGHAEEYAVEFTLDNAKDVDTVATVSFVSEAGVSAMRFIYAPELEVSSVTTEDGRPLEFVQWRNLIEDPNFDAGLVVDLGGPLPAGKPAKLIVTASGPLINGQYIDLHLANEDYWHPYIIDGGAAVYDLRFTVPKNHEAVAPGELLSNELDGNKRRYHYRTTRKHRRGSFYYGQFDIKDAKADDVQLQLFSHERTEASEVKFTAAEIGNAVKVFNRILCPLDLETLRVAGIPTRHGRGFEGLLLLGEGGGFGTGCSGCDVFRAHEVAHQWWGNLVDVKNWPEDRWIMESFADYVAMEYYAIRFQKPAKTREQMREQWVKRLLKVPEGKIENLVGQRRKRNYAEISPLIDGGGNVYTKGPWVLHMLRYLFHVQQKSDEGFWTLLQDFLEKYKFQEASTDDFIRLTEQHMQGGLGWFWDQWIYGTEIPTVRWSHEVTKAEDGGYLLTVNAEQQDTEFVLAIPIYVHMGGGQTLSTPLIMRGKNGQAKVRLRNKPSKVTLNDNFEALVEIKG